MKVLWSKRATLLVSIVFLCLLAFCRQARAQGEFNPNLGGMLNPKIDKPGEPFCYFWHPTDILGTLYAPVASEVTPEGYIYNGFGDLMFFTGNPPRPVHQRIRTLYKGYLPLIEYSVRRQGVTYEFAMFAADLGGALEGLPVNFVEVAVKNDTAEERTAFLSSGYRFSGPRSGLEHIADYRFHQRFDLIPKSLTEDQTGYDSNWQYSLTSDALVRNDRILYWFPSNPAPYQLSLTLFDKGFRMVRFFGGEISANPHPKFSGVDAHTPMGFVTYRVHLKPGESRSLVFKYPVVPIPQDSEKAKAIQEASFDHYFDRTVSFWENLVGNRVPLAFPEDKVQDALVANIIYSLLAIDKVGDNYITNINKFQYHGHWSGGYTTSYIDMALDYMGLNDIAKRAELYSLKTQGPSGEWGDPKIGYWGTIGEIFWMWGRHYLLTRDQAFLTQIYPSVTRGVEWLEEITQKDPLGLLPPTTLDDDEMLKDCHFTGENLRALHGLRYAIMMAKAMGNQQDAQHFETFYKRYREAFDRQLANQTAKTGGYIPPSLDRTTKGNDWDNLLLLYPTPLFKPFDPRVTATLRKTRSEYAEGILTYVIPYPVAKEGSQYVFNTTRVLHYWQTPNNSENELVRDDPQDQKWAVEDLYALLLHTSSAQATQEYGAYPWGTRDFSLSTNIMPDMVTSARLVLLMRDMVVREDQQDLYLFSAISPAWVKPGDTIRISDAPSDFGPVTALLRSVPQGLIIRITDHFRQVPHHIIIPIPWFLQLSKAEADGKPVRVTDGKLVLSPATHEVRISGKVNGTVRTMSFEQTVEQYKRQYAKRYNEFLRTGLANEPNSARGNSN